MGYFPFAFLRVRISPAGLGQVPPSFEPGRSGASERWRREFGAGELSGSQPRESQNCDVVFLAELLSGLS